MALRAGVLPLLLFSAFMLVSAALVSAQETAHLLVRKEVSSSVAIPAAMFVEKHNVTVRLWIYNVGDGSALDVELDDDVWGVDFGVLEGQTKHNWPSIAGNGTQTVEYVLEPLVHGLIEVQRAKVTYEDFKKHVQVGYSTPVGVLEFLSDARYLRMVDKHLNEWGLYLLVNAVACAVPLLVLGLIRLQFSDGVSKKYVLLSKKKAQ